MKFLFGIFLVAFCVFAETPLDMIVNNEMGQKCIKGPCKAEWDAYEQAWNNKNYAATQPATKAFSNCFVRCRYGDQKNNG
ncbi:hypothetical protein T11_2685 [Trichinella zimbabwensis]|uniref:Uncharacterized protein n=1 Tax=Trichinella zimbabwensis TaxID=268475 RepID=A0A0V1I285_9BILA|nr:hypothetical protein T11_2685 [Trichinella zimbabwensis]